MFSRLAPLQKRRTLQGLGLIEEAHMNGRIGQYGKWLLAVGLALTIGILEGPRFGALDIGVVRADGPDREDAVDGFRLDVFVLTGTNLTNPIGFCAVEPCAAGETVPTAELFNLTGSSLGVTWGDFQTVSARSYVTCKQGTTEIRVRLRNLRPNSVYSLFYRTFGADSINPFCINEERSIVVPERCTGAGCIPVADSRIESDTHGDATYVGEVPGCLLDAQTLLLDVIYHLNGQTYGPLPNQLEFATQNPPGCANPGQPGCDTCHSSFGNDAMRQAVVIQKQL
jgi:hypothetical protein